MPPPNLVAKEPAEYTSPVALRPFLDPEVAAVHAFLEGHELQVVDLQLLEERHGLQGRLRMVVDHQDPRAGRDREDGVDPLPADGALDDQDLPGLGHMALEAEGLALEHDQGQVRLQLLVRLQPVEGV